MKVSFFHADSALKNIVKIPTTCWTFCKKYGKHQPHSVTQYKKGKDTLCVQRLVLLQEVVGL